MHKITIVCASTVSNGAYKTKNQDGWWIKLIVVMSGADNMVKL
jgi:hypothetical protein